ncbi:MAG: hypothetical protein ABI114_01810 [Rhodanobacter sp.]
MSTYNQYDEANKIAMLLEMDGFSDQADQITNAMKDGKTGTEIFMILRFRLRSLLDIYGLPEETREQIRILYSKLDEALQ